MKLVIKVGTQSILAEDGTPFYEKVFDLVEQITSLQRAGHQVILVSSGAVASGRKIAKKHLNRHYGNSTGEKQLLASLGQHELMHQYALLFKQNELLISQLLLTKQDFQTRSHYLNIARLFNELLKHKNIIPIVNENDSVAVQELMFTDNDELAGLIAAQINADKLIILSNIQGVFTDHPDQPGAQIIPLIEVDVNWPKISAVKSIHGRGGMLSKMTTARKMANLGITTHIACLDQSSVLTRVLSNERIGTTLLARPKKSNIKRWMAYSSEQKNGVIIINQRLHEILNEKNQIISLLPIGIVRCIGQFSKGDLIEIQNTGGDKIGVGIARYNAFKLNEYLGLKDKPAFIHYDHLHLY